MGVWELIQDQILGMKWLNELIGIGQSRLRQVHGLLQDAGAFFAAPQLFQDGKPLGVA